MNTDAKEIANGVGTTIPVGQPSISALESQLCAETVASGFLSQGRRISEFERLISHSHGKKHGVACNSGTTALHLALVAMDVKHGDRVICPTMTMVAIPNVIRYQGANPVFVDSEFETGNMDQEQALNLFDRFQAKAIIAVHLYGVPASVDHLPSQFLIEDCAEAHYAQYANGRSVGSIGALACFSFYANKIIVTGEGGMVLTNDDKVEKRLRGLRSHSFSEREHFHHQELAFSYRMNDVQGAIGLAQHERHEELLQRREALAGIYQRRLAKVSWLRIQPHPPGSVWWVMPLVIREEPAAPVCRDELRDALKKQGIDTRTWFKPMHQQPHLMEFAQGQSFPVAEHLYEYGLYLPLYPDLKESDVDKICDIIVAYDK